MSRRKGWSNLSANQRNRYIRWGRKQGWSEKRTQSFYESGGNLRAAAGHAPQQDASEYQWRELVRLAKRSELAETADERAEILHSLLSKGITYKVLRVLLTVQHNVRKEYRSEHRKMLRYLDRHKPDDDNRGLQPGRNRYFGRGRWKGKRIWYADVEIYWYH